MRVLFLYSDLILAAVACRKDHSDPSSHAMFGDNGGGANKILPMKRPSVSSETMHHFERIRMGEAVARTSIDYTALQAAEIAEGILNSDYAYVDMNYSELDERTVTVNFSIDPEAVSEYDVQTIIDTALTLWVEHYNDVFQTALSKEGYFIDINVSSQSVNSFILEIYTSVITNPVEGVEDSLALTEDYYSWNENPRQCNSETVPGSIPIINEHIRNTIKARLPKRVAAYPIWVEREIIIEPSIYPNPNDITSFDNELDFLMFHYCECENYTWDTNKDYLCIPQSDLDFYVAGAKNVIVPSFDQNIPSNSQRVYATTTQYFSNFMQIGNNLRWRHLGLVYRTLFQYYVGEESERDRLSLSDL
jgi:hypothetical protein